MTVTATRKSSAGRQGTQTRYLALKSVKDIASGYPAIQFLARISKSRSAH
jgi:hypothetical protein